MVSVVALVGVGSGGGGAAAPVSFFNVAGEPSNEGAKEPYTGTPLLNSIMLLMIIELSS